MKANEAIREVMKMQDVKPSVLASRINVSNNVLSQRFSQKNISVDKLNEMLRALDYKVVILPRSARLQDGGIEID